MKIAMIDNDTVKNVAVAESVLPGWVGCPDDVAPGWTHIDGTWTAPGLVDPPRQTILTHREFILALGPHYAAIERLRDTNAALPPDQKNYELVRLFDIWDAASYIDLADADLVAAFEAFVGLGIMTQEAVDGILAG